MSSIYDYLIWSPSGELKTQADALDRLSSKSDELYRGTGQKELGVLRSKGRVTSLGKGNTRKIDGSYLASDIKLAARFALVSQRDKGNGVILILDRSKLPDLQEVDPGNFVTSYIPVAALKRVIDLNKIQSTMKETKISTGFGRKNTSIEAAVHTTLSEDLHFSASTGIIERVDTLRQAVKNNKLNGNQEIVKELSKIMTALEDLADACEAGRIEGRVVADVLNGN